MNPHLLHVTNDKHFKSWSSNNIGIDVRGNNEWNPKPQIFDSSIYKRKSQNNGNKRIQSLNNEAQEKKYRK